MRAIWLSGFWDALSAATTSFVNLIDWRTQPAVVCLRVFLLINILVRDRVIMQVAREI